jgi:hypothetical protein
VAQALAQGPLREAIQSTGATVFEPMTMQQAEQAYAESVRHFRALAASAPAAPGERP